MRAKRGQRQSLDVYQNGKVVGKLVQTQSGAVSFQYSEAWLEFSQAHPISMSLPLREEAFTGREASNYFDNLLPDHDLIREKLASRVRAESARTFDLLSAIGRDCVGALQFLPEGARSVAKPRIEGDRLHEAEIADRLKSLGFFPLGLNADADDFRISIAGAQEKTALLFKQGKWYLPKMATPTTHIFKPPMGIIQSGIDLSTSVENEWLCLKICEHLGLEVAKAQIARFGDQRCLVVQRFDREWVGRTRILRLPQEDLCQALGYPTTRKYQADGGPTIRDVMRFLDASDERSFDRATFIRSQLVFFLLAATDGHAKNFSVFLSRTGFRLTPMYDVMSVFPAIKRRQIAPERAKLAMSLGDSKRYRLKEISRRHFDQTAKACGFSQRELSSMIEEISEKMEGLESAIELPRGYPDWIFDSILRGVKKQITKLVGD